MQPLGFVSFWGSFLPKPRLSLQVYMHPQRISDISWVLMTLLFAVKFPIGVKEVSHCWEDWEDGLFIKLGYLKN